MRLSRSLSGPAPKKHVSVGKDPTERVSESRREGWDGAGRGSGRAGRGRGSIFKSEFCRRLPSRFLSKRKWTFGAPPNLAERSDPGLEGPETGPRPSGVAPGAVEGRVGRLAHGRLKFPRTRTDSRPGDSERPAPVRPGPTRPANVFH